MPLLGQKIYLAKFQEKRSRKGKGTFEIPFTNEVFTSKDDFDKQMQSYKQPIWTCQCTGFTGLTYEEALRSETEVHKRLSSKFPKSLEKPVLELVHHRAAPLDVIVDEAQQRIQSIFEVGEMVELKVKVRGKVIRGKILQAKEMSDDEIPTSDKENSVSEDHPYSSPQSHSKQNKSSPFQYNIQLDGEDKVISAVPGKDLLHTAALPSRDLLQLFIRASAVQAGSKALSPWVVSEELVKKFGLPNKINEVMLSPYKVMPSSLVKLTTVKRAAEPHDLASKPKKRKLSENNSGVSKLKQSSLMDFNKKDNMVLSVVLQREQNTSNMGLIQNTMATPPKHNPNIMASPEKVQLDHSYSSPPPHLKAAGRSSPKKTKSPKEKSPRSSKSEKEVKKTKKARASKKSKSHDDKRAKSSRSKTHSKSSSRKKGDSQDSESEDVVVIDDDEHETSKSSKSSRSGKTESKQDDVIVVDDSPAKSPKKTPNEKKANKIGDRTQEKKLPTKRKLTDHFKALHSPKRSPSKSSKLESPAKSKAASKSRIKAKKAKSTPVKEDKSKKTSSSKVEVEEVSSDEEDFEAEDKKKRKVATKKQPAEKAKKPTAKKAPQKKKQEKETKTKKSKSGTLTPQKETSKTETPQKATPKKAEKSTPKKSTPKKTPSKSTPSKTTPKKALTKKPTPKKQTPKKSAAGKETPKKATPKKTPKKATPKKTPNKATPAKKTPKKATPGRSSDKKKKPFKQATLFDVGAKKSAKKDGGLINKASKSPKSPRQPPIANKMFRIKSKDKDLYKKLVVKAAKELSEKQVNNLRPEIKEDVLIKYKERMEKLKWQNMSPEEREKILQQRKEEKRQKRNKERQKRAEEQKKERQKKAEELRKVKLEQAKRFEDQDLKLKALPAPKLVSMPEGIPNTLFGDIAMVVEFLNCYSGLLMPDDPYPITADSLMKALVYGKEGFAYLARVLVILLKTLLQDEIAEDYREINMKLSDMIVNMHTASELLRLSLRRTDHDHDNDDDRSDCSDSSYEEDDDVPYKVVEKLETCEFFELEPEEKLEILVCVCHRILGSYALQDFMEEKQKAAARLWKEKIQTLKEKNDKLKEEKQKKREQKEAERLEKEKLKEQQKEDQQSEDKGDSSDDKNKANGEAPADKAAKKKKPKKAAKKEDKTQANGDKPAENLSLPDEELDLASVVKRRRVLAAKVKAEKAEQEILKRERRMKELEVLQKQKDQKQFQKNFEDGIQLAKLSLRQCPVGTDRNHSRYWIFSTVIPGLFIEKGWADKDVGYSPSIGEDGEEMEAGSSKEEKQIEHTIPKIGQNLWFQYSSVKEIDALLEALDNQGIRESALYTELKKRYDDITRMTFLSRRSGPDLRDSDGPKELLDSFREDLSDLELNVRQGELGGVKNFDKWEKKLMSSTKLKDLGALMIECQDGVNPKFLQGIMAPIKPKPKQTNDEDEDDDDEDKSSEPDEPQKSEKLLAWIEGIEGAPTLSRLHIFLVVFETCVKWEKSAANAKCKICRKKKGDDKKLLLCDECNQPFHLFCLRPALTTVPKGEWKCPACAPSERRAARSRINYRDFSEDESSESSSEEEDIEHEETCAVCEEDGELVECCKCPSVYHRECHEPPLKNFPRGYWKCSDCTNPGRKRRAKKARQKRAVQRRKQKEESEEVEEIKPQRSRRNTKPKAEAKKKTKQVAFDSEVAESIISKLMCYRGSVPFRTSPDRAEAPDYEEIIKIPMDLHMLKNKCCNDEYESYQEFFADVKLIFSNAHEYYQESDYVRKQATKLEEYFLNQVKWAVPDVLSVWETVPQEGASTQRKEPTDQRPTRRSSRR